MNTQVCIIPTQLHLLIRHDTLFHSALGTNSIEAESQRAGHFFYAAWWTRQYDCQYGLAARFSATSLCQWGARACWGVVPRASGGCGFSREFCCRLLFFIACHP